MRFIAFLSAAVFAVASTAAGQSAPSSPASSSSPPVSIEKIRQELQNAPAQPLLGLNTQADFSAQIREKQKIEELLSMIKVPAGPTWPAGPYATELNRITNNPVDHPLTQPYAEFSQSELLVIAIENVVGRYFVQDAYNSLRRTERAHAEAAAHREVMRAIAQYCAAQPAHGAGIPSCYQPQTIAQTGTR